MKILVIDDEKNIRESIGRLFELEGIESILASNGEEGAEQLAKDTFDAVISDLKMPRMDGQQLLEWMRDGGIRVPVIMISALGDINDAVRTLKTGAVDYMIKPFDPMELVIKVRAAAENRKREDLIEVGARTGEPGSTMVGESKPIRALRTLIEKVAPKDVTVLITGESGTGKELVAREIHARSSRASEPFAAVNIGGIHENLMESELFGHEKGAFTGADNRKVGLFELAGAGTLFLDEIGETPLQLQVKLLRVLQERKIRRLGGARDIPVAARIISATNRDIEKAVQEGSFREDLYYRINIVRLNVPPLRDRREDIPLLAGHLLEKHRIRMRKSPVKLSRESMDMLSSYSFPGNVRELENVLERALIVCEGNEIMPTDLCLERTSIGLCEARSPTYLKGETTRSMSDVERDTIASALEKWDGNRTKAAQELGISRRTIINKINRYRLH